MLTKRFFLVGVALAAGFQSMAADWPSWRGPNSNQTTPETNFPLKWDRTNGVLWRVDLPGPGNSSPVVLGGKVFLTQAIEAGAERQLFCFNRANGKVLWKSGVVYREKERTHDANPYCPASPVTDGSRVIASFASAGVYCYDLNGKELWHADLGKQDHEWGAGSSPVLHKDLCLIFRGPGKGSFLTALDKRTGKELWRVEEPAYQPIERYDGFAGKSDGAVGSWSTPLVIKAGGRDEVVMSFPQQLKAFDPATGRELWTADGLNPLIYSSPVYGEGTVVAMGGYFGSAFAVKPGEGDLSGKKLWFQQKTKRHRIGTGIIHDGHVYFVNTIGVAECIKLATGETMWDERLAATGPNGEVWSSFVKAGDRLYAVNQSGDTFVVRAAPKYELLAVNPLAEKSNSTPALSNGDLFIRTFNSLWCISSKKGSGTAAGL